MKSVFTFLFAALFSMSFSQQGNNYSIDLTSLDSYVKKKNVAIYQGHIEKINHDGKSWYISQLIDVPKIMVNNDFIALSGSLSYTYLEGELQLAYRTKAGKKWSSWKNFTLDDHQSGIVSKIYFIPSYLPVESEQIQLRISANGESAFKLSSLNIRFYFPGEMSTSVIKQKQSRNTKAINCSCPLPHIEYRNDWCPSGNCPKDATPTSTVVSHLVVHHSAGSNTSPDWAATVRSIWDYHVNTQAWDDIAYNFLIDPNGVIYEGRGNDVSGAHFSCMNPGTMGVCLLGNFSQVGPSNAMINSLTELMGWKACDIDQDPRDTSYFTTAAVDLVNLCGHRDGNNIPAACTVTECPGNNVYAVMDNIRTAVFNYSQSCTLTPNYSNIVILSMGTNPMTIYEDEAVNLEVEFKNIGDEDINENLSIDYRLDGQSLGSSSFSSLSINQHSTSSFTYSFSSPGTYNYCVFIDAASNEINTSNNSFCVNVEVLEKVDTSITSINHLDEVSVLVYPNPTTNLLYIESEAKITSVKLYNLLGQMLLESPFIPLNLENLNKGVYTLKVFFEKGTALKSIKILKE